MANRVAKKPHCPRCGAKAGCNGRDIGGVEYYDYYILGCNQCGYVQAIGHNSGTPCCGSELANCPFCGSSENQHSSGEDIGRVVGNLADSFGEGILCEGNSKNRVN